MTVYAHHTHQPHVFIDTTHAVVHAAAQSCELFDDDTNCKTRFLWFAVMTTIGTSLILPALLVPSLKDDDTIGVHIEHGQGVLLGLGLTFIAGGVVPLLSSAMQCCCRCLKQQQEEQSPLVRHV